MAIVLSVLLILVVACIGWTGYWLGRFDALTNEYRRSALKEKKP